MSLPKITKGALASMDAIADGHPVYKVSINGNYYVIKAETAGSGTATSDVKWASKIMKNVAQDATDITKIRILEEDEIFEIAAAYNKLLGDPQDKLTLEVTFDSANTVWYMMVFDESIMTTNDSNLNDVAKKKQLFNVINSGRFWEKLGKIVAVDLFTGNNDRFDFGNYDTFTAANIDQFWSNKGNLFITMSGIGANSPVGLDFYFTSNAFGVDEVLDQKYLAIMRSEIEIKKVAGMIIDTIMKEFAGRELGDGKAFKTKISNILSSHLTTEGKFKDFLTKSITQGLNEIKNYLIRKRNEKQGWQQNAIANHAPKWQTNPLLQQQNVLPKQAIIPPTIPSHRYNKKDDDVLPVQHNTKVVDKAVFPVNLEKRMRALGWII